MGEGGGQKVKIHIFLTKKKRWFTNFDNSKKEKKRKVVSYPRSKCRWRGGGRRTDLFHLKRLPSILLTSAYIIDQNLDSHMATPTARKAESIF